ncbi:hypothetical protein EES47_21465 [Streptomyces sp. ADI98-12]|nr:hypothetical protein EES47_21465 [Streptomyces sp. ADI98-12]
MSASARGPSSGPTASGAVSASVVITEHVTHQARGWSPGREGSRQNSYSPAIAKTDPSAGVTK